MLAVKLLTVFINPPILLKAFFFLLSYNRKAMTELHGKAVQVFEDCLKSLKETHVKFIIWQSCVYSYISLFMY